jgi:hypothetical protein
VVAWGEINAGSLRQIYAKEWDGLDWQTPGVIASTDSRLLGTIVSGTLR